MTNKWDATILDLIGHNPAVERLMPEYRAIARAVELATIEACAKVCLNQGIRGNYHDEALCSHIAEVIRDLAKEET